MHDAEVDITNCDREPIHVIGRIQSFGFLLSVSPDWIVTFASRNLGQQVKRETQALIGLPAQEILSGDAIHAIRSRLQMLTSENSVERIFGLPLFGDGRLFDVSVHMSGSTIVIEAEDAADEGIADYIHYIRPMSDRIKQAAGTIEMCRLAARQLRALTGFDRVMVYRFAPDLSGEVIAESRAGGIDSFLNLHFPATDIPAQARKLYSRNLLRIISNIDDPTAEIVPRADPDGYPLDLTMSTLRAVSPIHIEYLRNMGVAASMSVSIMRGGELWGLFACHHHQPLNLSYPMRTVVELFGEMFAYMLDQSENRIAREQAEKSANLHNRLMSQVANGSNLLDNFESFAEAIGEVLAFDGIAAWIDGRFAAIEGAPDEDSFMELVRFLNTTSAGKIWHTDNLSAKYPASRSLPDQIAGLLAIPVSRKPRDYIVLFRHEIASSVRWAGNPEKAVSYGLNGARLTPRKSFEEWKEVVAGHCEAWTANERRRAESLRTTLIEVSLRLTDEANREREEASKRQEILIAELNHRVRNILNLIRSLIAQTRPQSTSIDDYAEVLGNRIYALARAHDQLTQSDWQPTPLRELIEVEARAYLEDDAARLRVEGVGVIIEPLALSTLSLVFHELITNSAKYGALSAAEGQVAVSLAREQGGGLRINWSETGGPEVVPPSRRGFGSIIIERSIPHELSGRASVEYRGDGFHAEFSIPKIYIDRFEETSSAHLPKAAAPQARRAEFKLPGTVLLVEDNVLIAMEAEECLIELGCENVLTIGNVPDALKAIEVHDIGCALLDVNLGMETSARIAERLAAKGVPFALATGFGENIANREVYGDAPVLTKPYTNDDLCSALAGILD